MGNSWFQFQQFKIHQDRCAMKISTDAVLLGALTDCGKAENILDIGTGTGVVALMLAQRAPKANIIAVEIDSDAAEQAKENFEESPFSSRLELFYGRFQDYSSEDQFDLIVSNPPYFSDHLKSPDPKRNKALHTDELSFADLATNTKALLKPNGQIWIILPPRQMEELRGVFKGVGLDEFERVIIRDREDSRVLREVSAFSFSGQKSKSRNLVLKNADGSYTEEYRQLISGFLLGY
ncbi:tRNA1(Val) (adenine(37)-N6)-methyltransferase [Algoriphagus mannitolivorans]|uniref:tRNA1(Val) (adenine(37)-N6)-methyltransferase n=1 Tax=Algoriphagus mannitolivorans TaxID=226504 RepID=UPI0003F7B972|nr:methyltransferase [Algoriphagus mannitolivorans]